MTAPLRCSVDGCDSLPVYAELCIIHKDCGAPLPNTSRRCAWPRNNQYDDGLCYLHSADPAAVAKRGANRANRLSKAQNGSLVTKAYPVRANEMLSLTVRQFAVLRWVAGDAAALGRSPVVDTTLLTTYPPGYRLSGQ